MMWCKLRSENKKHNEVKFDIRCELAIDKQVRESLPVSEIGQ